MDEHKNLIREIDLLRSEQATLADFLNMWAREQDVEQARLSQDDRNPLVRLADRIWGELNRRDGRRIAQIALLRRERALLIEVEKARTRILASIFETGGGCSAEDVRQVGELLMAVEALHLEASGGVQRPEGVGCACVLCRPEGRLEAIEAHTGAPGNSLAIRDDEEPSE